MQMDQTTGAMEAFDVVGLGVASVDELLWVQAYPPADAKVPVLRRARSCGGLSATALVAAARFGCRCAYAGILGADEYSRFVLDCLAAKGVNTEYVRMFSGAMPVLSVIVLDEVHKTRTILYDTAGIIGPEADWLPAGLLRRAKVLLVDNFRMDLTVRAARLARDCGVALVADLDDISSPRFDELLRLVDHLILSSRVAELLTGEADPAKAAMSLASPGRTVVVTCGADGAWYLQDGASREPVHQPAFDVVAVDTNGCGDVFHGVYAAELARGSDLPDRVRVAAAAAALSATSPGGQEGIPDATSVARFLDRFSNSSSPPTRVMTGVCSDGAGR